MYWQGAYFYQDVIAARSQLGTCQLPFSWSVQEAVKDSLLKGQTGDQLEAALSQLETHLAVGGAVAFGTYSEVRLAVLLSDHEWSQLIVIKIREYCVLTGVCHCWDHLWTTWSQPFLFCAPFVQACLKMLLRRLLPWPLFEDRHMYMYMVFVLSCAIHLWLLRKCEWLCAG